MPRVFVVANAPEGERIADWLAELPAEVQVGDGSDDTLAVLQAAPAQVVVLTAGLATGDALAFASALWESGSEAQLVLVADDGGPVKTALDAMEFRADRFLRRPLSRSALVFAVKSCLNLASFGRPGVAQAVAVQRRNTEGRRPLSAVFAALGDIGPASASSPAVVSSDVALHTLATRIEQATAEAVDAFLHDAVEQVLADDHDAVEEAEEPEPPEAEEPEPPEAEEPEEATPEWRESTLILSGAVRPPAPAATPPPPPPPAPPPGLPPAQAQPPEEARTGTFVSNLRRHMSDLEARLFGERAGEGSREDETGEIDLDAIGVTSGLPIPDDPPITTDVDDARAGGHLDPVVPATGRTPAPGVPGSLADEDVAGLLGRLARERFTGRLVVRGEGERTVYLEEGRPVFAGSSATQDRMGEQLVREGKISRDQLARAREVLAASGRRMGEILVEQGSLKRRELLPAVRRHVEDVLYALFSWETGHFSLHAGTGAREEKIRLATPAPALIVEGVRRKLALERLRALVGPAQTVLLPARREDAAETLGEAELGAEERQAVDLFDGRRTIGEVAAALPGELVAWQMAHALLALGLAARLPRDPTETGRGTTTSPGAPVGSLTGAADAAIDRERVLAKHAQVREADYFELLGVRRDATGFEIRRAFEAARRDYAPETFPVEVQRELETELAEIADVLAEAQRILRDDRVRASYRAGLVEE